MDSEIEWNRGQVMTLINLYRNQAILWNQSDPDYKDKHKKRQAWRDIANALQVSKATAQNKMRNLLTQFHRELRKTSGFGSVTEEANIKWAFYHPLLFLKDKATPVFSRRDPEYGVAVEHEAPIMIDDTSNPYLSTLVHVVEDSNEPVDVSFPPQSTTPPPNSNKRNYHQMEEHEESASSHREFRRKDEFDTFGEHVAWQIRNLNDKMDQALAKYRINKLLFDIEMSQINSQMRNEQSDDASKT